MQTLTPNPYAGKSSSISASARSTAPVLKLKGFRLERGAWRYPKIAVTSVLVLFSLINMNTGLSLSLYNESEISTNNLLQAGEWDTQAQAAAPLLLSLSAPQDFAVQSDTPPGPPPDDPGAPPAELPPVEVSEPVTTIEPPAPAVTVSEDTPPVIQDAPADTALNAPSDTPPASQ